MAAQADGKILAGGDFTMMGGQARSKMARLNSNGTLDTAFDPNAQNRVSAIVVQADGKILAGGFFNGANSIGGQTRNRIARLEPGSGLADSFNPNASGSVLAIAVQADGKILAGGSFNGASSIGGLTRNRIARLETDGGLDRTLDLSMNPGNLFSTAVQADGKILIGGGFSTVLGTPRNNIVRLNSDGTLDANFNPNANGFVYAIAVQADGKVVIGGDFTFVTGQPRNRIARLNPITGFVDSFNPNADNGVRALALQADGKILVSGNFANIGGATRSNMARLDPATGLADSFDPNVSGRPNAIAVQPDGRIVIGGIFSSVAGMTRNNMARVNSDGTLDAVFNPDANNVVNAIALQADGKVLAGGDFNEIGGEPRNRIARLDPSTGLADSFNPNANSIVNAIAVQGDGRIIAAGFFNGVNSIGGQTRNRIARLDPNIGLADSFHPNASNVVFSLALQGDGKILAGGGFLTIGGQSRTIFARLSNDTAALQNLAVTQTSVTWTRGGASPQFTRVIFEFSNDNLSYSLLGNAVGSGSNWTLSGLSLATEQNFYIRARGYYRSGYGGGSESTAESVRNAFITLPPTPTAVVSRKIHGGTPRDINLPLTGNSGIECRSGGATNDYQVKISFANAVTVNGIPQADVTIGTGDVGTGGSSNGGAVSINGAVVTVPLTNVANAQTILITLYNVSDGTNTGNLTIPMSVLLGDTTGNGAVNSSDIGLTKSKSGQTASASNFRTDVTVSGSINSSDIGLVKSKSGTALP